MLLEEIIEEPQELTLEETENPMPSFNHSVICAEIIEQFARNEKFRALPELTLDIDKGITPDVSVYLRTAIKPYFLRDFLKYPEMPLLAIEVISPTQNIQTLLEKAQLLVRHGVKAVWTIEPFTGTIFVTDAHSEQTFYKQEVESEGIKVDFKRIFG